MLLFHELLREQKYLQKVDMKRSSSKHLNAFLMSNFSRPMLVTCLHLPVLSWELCIFRHTSLPSVVTILSPTKKVIRLSGATTRYSGYLCFLSLLALYFDFYLHFRKQFENKDSYIDDNMSKGFFVLSHLQCIYLHKFIDYNKFLVISNYRT